MLIGLNITAPEGIPFLCKRVGDFAARAGMTLNKGGSYEMRDATGHILFTLSNHQGKRFVPEDASQTAASVTLLFDVPNAFRGLEVFDGMTVLGFDLARNLGGRVMDDHGHVVSQTSLANDRKQLDGFYKRMEAYGIPAGSERARRLFA
jgi:FtsZ-interacting cell division protein ZipA